MRTDTMTPAQAQAAEIDVGLRQYMLRVYNYMALGVAFTGIIAMVVAMNPAVMQAIGGGPFVWVLFIGIIGMGFVAPRIMMTKSVMAAQACFWVYSAMWGALIVNLFLQSSVLHLLMSIIVPLIFAGLTAYETQQIKSWYYEGDIEDATHKKSIFGAFLLYGSFVTMFIWLMQLFGVARE